MKALSHGLPRYCETTLVGRRSNDRIFIVASAEENAVVDHSDWTNSNCRPGFPYKCEHQSTVGSVVFDDAFGKWWTIRRPTLIILCIRAMPAICASRGLVRRMCEPLRS